MYLINHNDTVVDPNSHGVVQCEMTTPESLTPNQEFSAYKTTFSSQLLPALLKHWFKLN